MKKIVEKFLKKKNLLNENEIFIIAFSGGFDSMALANIFIDLSSEYNFKVILAHLNHNWRGKKSLAEAKNCAVKKSRVLYRNTPPKYSAHRNYCSRREICFSGKSFKKI